MVDTEPAPLQGLSQKLCEGGNYRGVVRYALIPPWPTPVVPLWRAPVHVNYSSNKLNMTFFVILPDGVFWPLVGGNAGETVSMEHPSTCESRVL